MVDRNSPVTEDELHAFVDGELPPERRHAVEAWLGAHPEDAALLANWRTQAESLRTRYGAVAKEPVPERLALNNLIRNGKRWKAFAVAAAVALFFLGGGTGWLLRGKSIPARNGFELFTAEALDAHRLYIVEVRHPVEVPGAERAHLVQWLSKRLGQELRAPDLEALGLKLIGGRLLPGPTGATAFFMYEGRSGERFTLYCGRATDTPTAMRYSAAAQFAAMYWVDRNIAYVLSGPSDRERLAKVAEASYEQIDALRSNGGS